MAFSVTTITGFIFANRPCQRALPTGTLFGASISTANISADTSMKQVDAAFGTVPIVRTFDPGLPLAWSMPRNQVVQGRDVVTSFRPPPQEILSGQHDKFFTTWFRQAPADQHVYWSYVHEPEALIDEGEFTPQEYVAAWEHLAQIADDNCKPNVHATLILTGFTASNEDRSYQTYDPGPDVVDVLAFDPYNGVFSPDRTFYQRPDELLGPIMDIVNKDGRAWGIAEIGSRLVPGDPDGERRAQWLTDIAEYAKANDALFVTYFQSTRGANWRLDDPPSRRAWSTLVDSSR